MINSTKIQNYCPNNFLLKIFCAVPLSFVWSLTNAISSNEFAVMAESLSSSVLNPPLVWVILGLIFCGANAYRINKMMSVKELLDELIV